jgi:UDP-GlcNAc3NAcA epimerase
MPEEINRVVTDHLSTLLFAPTPNAVANLEREGISGASVRLVGDVMYDVALQAANLGNRSDGILDRLGITSAFVLATIHRAENTDAHSRLRAIIGALEQIGREMPVVFPMHPRTTAAAAAAGIDLESVKGVSAIEPLGYLDMISLEQRASAIVTDSGGVQKEAFFFGTPCVTVRHETEWVELIESGWNRLAPPEESGSIAATVLEAARSTRPANKPPFYGNGNAAELIAAAIMENAS